MNRLREERKNRGLSQYELGRLVGKYQSRIWQIEKGYLKPGESEKQTIAEVLEVDVTMLFPGEP
jgi:transcriptional regulator with XRE-family HTH domain